jgi:hypothetical protein
MANIPYPLVNGQRHSWSSIEARIAGQIVLGFTEINYSPTLEPGIVRGAGSLPIGMTRGNAEFDADFTILLEEFNNLVTILGERFMLVPFDIVVSYDESDSGLSTIVDTIQNCRITKIEASNSSGTTDGTARKCTVKHIGILLNGVNPMPEQPTVSQ